MIRIFIHIILCLSILFSGSSTLFPNQTYSTDKISLSSTEGTQITKDKGSSHNKFPSHSNLLFEEDKETKKSLKDNIKVLCHFITIFSIYDTSAKKHISPVNFGSYYSSIPLYLFNSIFIL